jgi:hypothetical protein
LKRFETIFIESILALVVFFVSASLLLNMLSVSIPFDNLATEIKIAAAKCPGIPGGSGSGGIDYINIAIDVGLVSLLALFLFLTVRDLRRKKKANADVEPSEKD